MLPILLAASVWLCMPSCEWRTVGRLPMSEIHNPYRENEVAPKNCILRNDVTPGVSYKVLVHTFITVIDNGIHRPSNTYEQNYTER